MINFLLTSRAKLQIQQARTKFSLYKNIIRNATNYNYKNNEQSYIVNLADRGDPEAQYEVAINFLEGKNSFKHHPQLGRLWLTKSASNGHTQAEYKMGKLLLYGKFVKKDLANSFRHFSRAAAKGHVESMAILGNMLINGVGCDENLKEAFKWLKEAALKGNFRAMGDLGSLYCNEKFKESKSNENSKISENSENLEKITKNSEKMTKNSKNSENLEKNDKKMTKNDFYVAKRLAEKSGNCQGGNIASSQRLAGQIHQAEKNLAKAKNWFEKASIGGDIEAMASLGKLILKLTDTKNLKKDEIDEAIKWLIKSGNLGHQRAQRDLGFLYSDGQIFGIKQDMKKGFFYLETAGLFGLPEAYLKLAEIHATGNSHYENIETNLEKSKKYIRLARKCARENKTETLEISTWKTIRNDPKKIRELIIKFENCVDSTDGKEKKRIWMGSLKHLKSVEHLIEIDKKNDLEE